MKNNLLVVPVILPLFTAILIFLISNIKFQKLLSFVSTTFCLATALYLTKQVSVKGIQTLSLGDWPAPFGIVIALDLFSGIMLILTMIVSLAALIFSFKTIGSERENYFYYAFFQLQIMGINGALITGDIFNLFVFFEILLIASYILMALGGKPYQLQETTKYMIINMVSSVLFLVGVAVLYSTLGSLNMADLSVKVGKAGDQGILKVIAVIFMIVFGIKGGLFPLYFWLPRSYHAAPSAVAVLFGGLMTKVGIYAILRVYTLIFAPTLSSINNIILIIAGLTMFLGVMGAVAQMDFKLLLSYHIISQVGYMIMGLGLYTPLSITGAIYFLIHNIIVKSCLFLISGIAEKLRDTTDLKKMGGLMATDPSVAYIFLIAGFSLAGAPPFSGFFGKFLLIRAGLEKGSYLIVFVSILVSFFTLYSMTKIFKYAFWGTAPENVKKVQHNHYFGLVLPAACLALLTVFIGLNTEWVYSYVNSAAYQLMNPDLYIQAVLGG
ncbi:MAG: multicomponent Na+:H+ antiporter subunit [Thermosediminibacterales bacterium]|nr:multicomponent Na+:H+ antiporter subunit [Thermosediminibacterales bacterium]MDK2836259.1 multicomponent Na+:H+ antiporter subunit [Thermosediminibacterales bacterium]